MEALESTTGNQPGAQTVKRREILALYLVQLEEAQRSGADLQKALDGIDLDAWELAQLDRGLGGAPNRWYALVAEGVASATSTKPTSVGPPGGRNSVPKNAPIFEAS